MLFLKYSVTLMLHNTDEYVIFVNLLSLKNHILYILKCTESEYNEAVLKQS